METNSRDLLIMEHLDRVQKAIEVVEMDLEQNNMGLARDHAESAKYAIESALLLISDNSFEVCQK